jgi:hypothetical protein
VALTLLLAMGVWMAPAVRAQPAPPGPEVASPVTGRADGPIPASIGTTVGWRVVRDVAEPPGHAIGELRALGFGVPIDDPILTTNVDTGRVMAFAPGEVFYVIEESTTRRESQTDDAVPYYRIALVPPDEASDPGGDTLVFAGGPFELGGEPSRLRLHATNLTVGPQWFHVYGGTKTALLLVVDGAIEYGAADGQGGVLTAGEAATIDIPPSGGPDANAIAVNSVDAHGAQIVVATIDE